MLLYTMKWSTTPSSDISSASVLDSEVGEGGQELAAPGRPSLPPCQCACGLTAGKGFCPMYFQPDPPFLVQEQHRRPHVHPSRLSSLRPAAASRGVHDPEQPLSLLPWLVSRPFTCRTGTRLLGSLSIHCLAASWPNQSGFRSPQTPCLHRTHRFGILSADKQSTAADGVEQAPG